MIKDSLKGDSKGTIKLNKINNIVLLFFIYKNILTEKQREIFELYYFEDFSVNEIAKIKSISKPGVFDNLKKTEINLVKIEEQVGLKKMIDDLNNNLILVYNEVNLLSPSVNKENLLVMIEKIKNIL